VPPLVLPHSTGGSGLHPYQPVGAPVTRTSEAMYLRDTPCFVSPFCSALLCRRQILWPLLTSCSLRIKRGRPFRHKARSPQVRRLPFTARPPDLRRLILDHESFAVIGPLALIGTASNPVSVRRPTVSLHASFPRSVALPQLRFASIAMVNSWEDFHLQGVRHAGRNRVGGGVAPAVLPHHRTYGSVYGGS